jgi:hypothetical protein
LPVRSPTYQGETDPRDQEHGGQLDHGSSEDFGSPARETEDDLSPKDRRPKKEVGKREYAEPADAPQG